MAVYDCNFCHIKHPRPVGRNCLKKLAAMSQVAQQSAGSNQPTATQSTQPATKVSVSVVQVSDDVIAPNTNPLSSVDSHEVDDDDDSPLDQSRASCRDRPSAFEREMISKLRSINRNIEFMIGNMRRKGHWRRFVKL
jgi:hypothetical protein